MNAISTVDNHNYIPGLRKLIDSRQTSFMRENVKRYIVSLRSKNLVIVIFKHKLDFKICQCSKSVYNHLKDYLII